MDALRRRVDATMSRARIAQRQGAEAQRRSVAARAGAREALDWISERNEARLRKEDALHRR